jgi:hypothetical protein
MEQDFSRLKRLQDELASLRAICKSEFVIRSIDEVMTDIGARLQSFETIGHNGAAPYQRGDEAPALR